MPAFDFPASPTLNQQYAPAGGPTYQWNGSAWIVVSAAITPWVEYTPTFVGIGTPPLVKIRSRRVGDTLQIRGRFQCGTTTAVTMTMTLGFNGVNGGIVSDPVKVDNLQLAGSVIRNANGAVTYYALISSNVGTLNFSVQHATGSAYTAGNGTLFVANDVISLMVDVPISGWT